AAFAGRKSPRWRAPSQARGAPAATPAAAPTRKPRRVMPGQPGEGLAVMVGSVSLVAGVVFFPSSYPPAPRKAKAGGGREPPRCWGRSPDRAPRGAPAPARPSSRLVQQRALVVAGAVVAVAEVGAPGGVIILRCVGRLDVAERPAEADAVAGVE